MGTFQLIIKQMRQRALGTWLTLLSVLLGVALAIVILLLRDAGESLFGQTEFGSDLIVGVGQGSATQLVMNTIYHIDESPGKVPYWVYEALTSQRAPRGSKEFNYNRYVKVAVPIMVGDTYAGRPIVGTLPKMFISLAPLKAQVDALIQTESELVAATVGPASALPADLPGRQMRMLPMLDELKQQIEKTDRETVPLLVEPAADAPPPKYKYGDPVSSRCDDARKEMSEAAAALQSKNPDEARKHERSVLAMLGDVRASIDANSGPLEYRPDHDYELAAGRIFHPWKFQAVLGSEVAKKTGLTIGSKFRATHGAPSAGQTPDIHPEQWEVVGILKPTHTASDRCLYIPLLTLYTIAEHEVGLKADENVRNGKAPGNEIIEKPKFHLVPGNQLLPDLPATADFIDLDVPQNEWEISAIMIRSRGGILDQDLRYFISNGGIPGVQAVNPANVMRVFFDTFLRGSAQILLLISLLVSVVAGVGILVSIYNSVSARTREIAILRALGATRGRILTLICAEAVLIGALGSLLGLLAGHALGGIASTYMNNFIGQGFDWISIRPDEFIYMLIVVGIALFAGLVPALKAYQTPVATNLVAS